MIGFLHFAILNDELYVLGPPMPDWVNGLYFLTLAEIQEARLHSKPKMVCNPQQHWWSRRLTLTMLNARSDGGMLAMNFNCCSQLILSPAPMTSH
jgi:hypothetical protein